LSSLDLKIFSAFSIKVFIELATSKEGASKIIFFTELGYNCAYLNVIYPPGTIG
jgi:hypothetical protein